MTDTKRRLPFGVKTPAKVVDVNKDLIRFRGTVAECEEWISCDRNRAEENGIPIDDLPEYEVEPDADEIARLEWDSRIRSAKEEEG